MLIYWLIKKKQYKVKQIIMRMWDKQNKEKQKIRTKAVTLSLKI